MKAKNPHNHRIYFFIDKCLPFGSSISCALFQSFSDALAHIAQHKASTIVPGQKKSISNYLDDFLFFALVRQICNDLMKNFMSICRKIICPLALEKTEWATPIMTFLGMLLNGSTYTLSIPLQKLEKAAELLKILMDRKKAKVKTIQPLTGLLNFLNRAIIPGRTFTRRMYDNIKWLDSKGHPLKNHHHVSLTKGFKKDCKIWLQFLEMAKDDVQLLCRPFLDLNEIICAKQIKFYSDASLNAELGMGALLNNNWIVGKWGKNFINSQKPSIEFLELFALVAGILTWTNKLTNCRIQVYCDNESVVHMINNCTSRCPQCMKLMRLLILDG